MSKKAVKKKKVTTRKSCKIREVSKPYLDVKPVEQKDGVSCGLCACSAVYKFFKISTSGLRKRLGVDEPPVPPFWFPLKDTILEYLQDMGCSWGGTLPPDLCEVIWEDGFDYETTTDYDDFIGAIPLFLEMGYPALVLVRYGNAPLAHWVVAAGITEDEIYVVDSYPPNGDWVSISGFKKRFHGAIMITDYDAPREPGLTDYIRNYTYGAKMGVLAAGKEWGF